MEVRQLEIFRALAGELNFTRTAERVHCVQSNVTAQIHSLEQELGQQLFDRLAKRVVLTDAGKRLLPYAEKVLVTLTEAKHALSQGSTPSGPLRVGAPESLLAYRLPKVLRKFRKQYPDVELIFRPYEDANLVAPLETGHLDVTIRMVDEIANERLASIRLRTERVIFVTSPTHALAAKAKVTPEDLRNQTMLLTEAGVAYRKKLDDLLALRGVHPKNTAEFSSVEAIKACAALGMGIALLPEIVVTAEVREGRLRALRWQGTPMDISTHLIWHKDKWISPAMAAFVKTLKRELQE